MYMNDRQDYYNHEISNCCDKIDRISNVLERLEGREWHRATIDNLEECRHELREQAREYARLRDLTKADFSCSEEARYWGV